jgi:hypothetical protein
MYRSRFLKKIIPQSGAYLLPLVPLFWKHIDVSFQNLKSALGNAFVFKILLNSVQRVKIKPVMIFPLSLDNSHYHRGRIATAKEVQGAIYRTGAAEKLSGPIPMRSISLKLVTFSD